MDEQQKPVVKVQPIYKPTKFLISSLNTQLGNFLVKRLRNDDVHPQNPNTILGTTCSTSSQTDVPDGVRKTIDTGKVKFFQQIILNSDIIIYDLNTCDLKEAEFVISTLKINKFASNKILICISDVMTWAKTKPKQKKQGDEQQGDDNPPQQPDTEVQGQAGGEEGQEKKVYVRFQDKDYSLRKSDPSYQKIKSIQTLAMATGKSKSNLKSYIICSGIVYGQGERVFAPYFMQARLQQPQALTFYGNGKNRIPMIHIKDLVTYVQKTIQLKPDIPYLLAIDHNPKPTQKRVIQAISQGIGTGKIVQKQPTEDVQNIKILTLNLRMKPTMIFAKMEEEQAAVEREQGDQTPKFTFKWQYRQGLQKSIKKLCEEFNDCRGLTQTKILIVGPPGSGKSHYSKQLAQKYYLPHIHMKSVIEAIKNIPGQGSLGEQIKNYLTEKKQELAGELQTKYDEQKEKQKKIPKQLRQPLEPFNGEKVDVRLSDQLLYKCFKWRLNQNDCLNRGYILDGFPKKYQDAENIFMGLPPVQEDQEPDQNAKKIVEPKLIPNKLVILEMSDEQIFDRIQNLQQIIVQGTHLDEKATKRRLKLYRQAMNAESGQLVLEDFFKQNKVSIHKVNAVSQTMNLLQSIIKPMPQQEESQQQVIKRRLQAEAERRRKLRQDMDKKQTTARGIQHQDYRMKKQNQQNEQRQILDEKSRALRRYLDANLVPILSEGLVQILTNFPSDPVDTLAQFLFQNSLKVPNPDPSTFNF